TNSESLTAVLLQAIAALEASLGVGGPDGVATLDGDGKLSSDERPDYVPASVQTALNEKLVAAQNLSDLGDASAARNNLDLGNVNNTSDANKPVSTAQAAAIATKADRTRTVSGAGLATGSETLDNNPVITVTAATEADVSLGKSSATVVTPVRLAELIAAFLGQDAIGDGVAFSFGGLAYFDQRGGFRGQIAEPVGAYGLSDTYESAETDGTGRVIRARTWGGLDYAPGDPAQGFGLSAEYQHVEMTPDGSLLRGQRWDGSSREEGNGPFILDNLWAEQTETGALLRRMRMDKTFAIGPTHRIEWTAYVDGEVYLVAEGRTPFRVTRDAGTTYTYLSAKMEGLRLEIVRKAISGGAVDMVTYALPGAVTVPEDVTVIEHVTGTGQSLSVGASTNGVVTPTNPDPKLLMFNGGVKTLGGFHQISQRDHALFPDRLTDLVPAYEVAVGGQGETPMTRMGAAYRATLAANRAVLVSAHGVGSVPHSDLERGGQIYANSLAAVFWARLVAGVAGLDYRCKYVSDIQGEGNIGNTAAQRVADLIQLQEQYTEDINALTGQVGEVVLAQCQTSNATMYGYTELPGMPEGQLQVAIDNPTKHICPGPKYWCEYSDGTHLTAEYSAKLGEVHAYHIARFEAGEDALPLYGLSAVVAAGKLTITFRVPDDTTWEVNTSLVTDPGNWGVTFHDDGDGNSVTLSNGDSPSAGVITYDISAVPTGSNPKIGIAATGSAAAHAGPTTGMRSNFCAITASSHYDATPIRLWAAHQYIPVTV
ncbi:hypothetical protein LCM17_21095, partial [Cereibacter sphaeroides]|nr:hypothetical protein [Cereibacter sphaeroides]